MKSSDRTALWEANRPARHPLITKLLVVGLVVGIFGLVIVSQLDASIDATTLTSIKSLLGISATVSGVGLGYLYKGRMASPSIELPSRTNLTVDTMELGVRERYRATPEAYSSGATLDSLRIVTPLGSRLVTPATSRIVTPRQSPVLGRRFQGTRKPRFYIGDAGIPEQQELPPFRRSRSDDHFDHFDHEDRRQRSVSHLY